MSNLRFKEITEALWYREIWRRDRKQKKRAQSNEKAAAKVQGMNDEAYVEPLALGLESERQHSPGFINGVN